MTVLLRPVRALFCLLLAAPVLAPVPLTADPQEPDGRRRLEFTDVVPEAPSGDPSAFTWSPDGTRLAFLRDDGVGEALWVSDPLLGRVRRLAGVSELDPGGRDADTGIEAFQWAPNGATLLVEAGGDLHLVDARNRAVRALTRTAAEETDAAFSPAGDAVIYVRDHDLWLLDLGSGGSVPLTAGGQRGVTLNGVTDWVYWEEIWGRNSTGFWWSPDGTRVAYYSFDETPVPTYALVDFTPVYPRVEPQRYPKAGQTNPVVRIGVKPVAGGDTIWMQTGQEDTYLARVHWAPDGTSLAVQRLNREQDRLDLLRCEVADGSCRTILTQSWPTWVNLGNDFVFLDDGRFIWGSERQGWRHLYLYDADGRRSRRLTPDGWSITSLDGVDEASGHLLVTGFRTEPWGATDRHVLRVPLGGEGETPVRVLTSRPGWHEAVAAAGTGLWVHAWSDADTPTAWTVEGDVLDPPVPLPSDAPPYDVSSLPAWEFLTIEGPQGRPLPARMLLPEGFRAGRRYPVIMYHYGGPGSQVVVNRWGSRARNIFHKKMAQDGYVVFSVDNEASLFFGKDGEDRVHRRFGEVNLAAQLAAVDHLGSKPFVDAEHIGLWGWSGGGTNTLYCLLNRPGVWHAGVSGAPVTDWHLYDSIWTERYLDHPRDNPDGYEASSPVTHAGRLEDRLLIVHGTADDNVHPQNTLQMIDRFVEEGVLFEEAIYPRQKHGFRGDASRHFFRRMAAFFDRHLRGR